MLAYILGITKRDNKGIANRGRFQGLQIGVRRIANRGSLRHFKSGQGISYVGQRDFKSRQRLPIRARKITNRGRDFKLEQGLQIGVE